ITNQTITVANLNGYALELTNTVSNAPAPLNLGVSLANPATPNFNVQNATASNVIQGLNISAQLTGFANITKSGQGTLVLSNAGNSFQGNITINLGVVSAGDSSANNDNSQLGNVANKIILSPTTGFATNGTTVAGTATFRATADTTFNTRVIQLANVVNNRAIEVTVGKTLTINTPFDLNNGAGTTANLVKADNGTVVLTANNSAWNGSLLISGGAVQLAN